MQFTIDTHVQTWYSFIYVKVVGTNAGEIVPGLEGSSNLHHKSVVPMLFFDLVFTPPSTKAFILLFLNNIDD